MRTLKFSILYLLSLMVVAGASLHLLRFLGVEGVMTTPVGAPFYELSLHFKERIARGDMAFLAHLLGGSLALLLGPFQFWEGLRNRQPQWHRRMGYGYFLAITLGGLGGLFCAPTAWAGVPAQIGFTGLALVWLSSAVWGLRAILRGEVDRHRSIMRLSYALTLAAVSLRIQMPLLHLAGLSDLAVYRTVAWSCWMPQTLGWLGSERPWKSGWGTLAPE